MLNCQEKTHLWIVTQKLKAYLRSAPFRVEGLGVSLPVAIAPIEILPTTQTLTRLTEKPILKEESLPKTNSYLDLPLYAPTGKVELLVLTGALSREALSEKEFLSLLEKEALEAWMKAIGLRNFGVKSFPWSDKTICVSYREAQNWLWSQLDQTGAKFILSLGEETLSFFTGYPTLLEFTHGVDFPLNLKEKTITILPTYSLKDVLQDPKLKRDVWRDLKRLLGILSHEPL